MESFFVFAVIGMFTGAAARLLYPGRQSTHILGTMLLGVLGAMVGGMISWSWWSAPETGEFHTGNLILSVLGAMIVIVLWPVPPISEAAEGSGTRPNDDYRSC